MAAEAAELIDEAVAADDFETAEAALVVARAAVPKAKSLDLARTVTRAGNRVAALRKDYAAVEKDALTLATRPADPEASLAMGKYLCYHKDDWLKGLPLLAAGSDADLAALAQKDWANPREPKEQADVGLAWWDRAEKETGAVQRACAAERGAGSTRPCRW